MASEPDHSGIDVPRGPIKGPQSFVGGLALVAFAIFALWAMSNLDSGSLRAMGPGMMPRSLGWFVLACGAAIAVLGIVRPGERLERFGLRAPLMVGIALLAFAVTIRQFGLAVAGPLAMLIGGYATPEARPVELVVFTAIMTVLCIAVFRYALNLPIPILIIPNVVYI